MAQNLAVQKSLSEGCRLLYNEKKMQPRMKRNVKNTAKQKYRTVNDLINLAAQSVNLKSLKCYCDKRVNMHQTNSTSKQHVDSSR